MRGEEVSADVAPARDEAAGAASASHVASPTSRQPSTVVAAGDTASVAANDIATVAASVAASAKAGAASLISAGAVSPVAAGAFAPAPAGADHSVAVETCQNCGAPLTAKYCASCGQRHDPHIHSLGEFLAEATESITHADSRVWRTLWALMVKPGFLTKEFLEGRRARYLPPFRLYLVLSVVFFVIATAGGGDHNSVGFVQLHTGDGKPSLGVQKLDELPAKPSETPEQRANRICTHFNFVIGNNEGLIDGPAVCRKIAGDNGHALVEALYHNIPRALIVLLPLLALTMRFMYRRRHYVEHLLFFVHTHAFAFVFLTLYVLVMRFVPYDSVQDTATLVMLLGLPYYTYRAMRRVYAQGKWVTRVKFWFLTLSYFVLGLIMTILLGLYTAVTL